MPELPEVETIRRSLAPLVVGRRVERVDVLCAALRRPVPPSLSERLIGRAITDIGRRGKYLLLTIDAPPTWIFHMGMSGRLLHVAREVARAPEKHDHVLVTLSDGGRLVFHDPRRFGLMLLEDAQTCPWLRSIGPEPFDEAVFHGGYLAALRRATRRAVKDVLMDQRVVAGLGNIYVNEILFAARVRPTRRLERLTRAECDAVVAAVHAILSAAIEHRGSSVSDFLDGIGRRGGYQWHHRVYDRKGEPCPRCGAPIRGLVVGQRSTFYCPRCQR